MDKTYEELAKNCPYLTGLNFSGKDYIGVLQNQNAVVTSFYDYEDLPTPELKNKLLELADSLWWESNRIIPINIFIGKEFGEFKPFLKTMATKDVTILFGPVTSLDNVAKKRVKRRTLQLVRKVD